MPIITNLGSSTIVFTIVTILLIYGILKNNVKIKRIAIIGLIALIITTTIIFILKISINEPRPFISLKYVNLLIIENDPYSFPSGHSGNIFAFATAFGLNWKLKIKEKSFKLAWILFPIGILVCFSRIYIGVHYPFDILFGAIIGTFGGLIATMIVNKYIENRLFKNK
ncbi:putative undecaprenyl-diphosphatase YbjG [bioreactor metagenome]|uniref:Putative undecaprenyl-diphosphatase YbjG n=1 Tax=bioreactor metagenome TaxID=1076179 RepID=A0A644T4U8_9ZZZZ|nr:phosphatase PAP2 family protein [Methanobrevibacter sp.]MEA4956999.1 phosphatase PAP2 family protein [Methanobrevibacter sp.]